MKRVIFFVFALAATMAVRAQLSISVIGNGKVELHYGASNDYTLYDPQGDTTVYVYLWVDTSQTNPALSQQYNDDWNNASSLEVLHYDSQAGHFVGTIDFNTHQFPGEGIIPENTRLNDFNLILRNEAGNRQSADLLASTYGFTGTTLPVRHTVIHDSNKLWLRHDMLYISEDLVDRTSRLQIFDLSGKMLWDTSKPAYQNSLPAHKSGIILVKLWVGNTLYVSKFLVK